MRPCAGSPPGRATAPPSSASWRACPPGCRVTSDDVAAVLARRRLGHGRGARMKFEQDQVSFLGGLRHGVTMGGPLAVQVANTEWPKWQTVMSPDPVDADELAGQARNAALTRPRPGPRRPRRHAEVRLRRRPARAGARQRPGDRRPGRARHRSPPPCSSRPPGSAWSATPSPSARSRCPRAPSCPAPTTSPRWTPTPSAATTTATSEAMVEPRSTPRAVTATPWAGWSRCSPTACRRAWAATCTPTAASTAASPAP